MEKENTQNPQIDEEMLNGLKEYLKSHGFDVDEDTEILVMEEDR